MEVNWIPSIKRSSSRSPICHVWDHRISKIYLSNLSYQCQQGFVLGSSPMTVSRIMLKVLFAICDVCASVVCRVRVFFGSAFCDQRFGFLRTSSSVIRCMTHDCRERTSPCCWEPPKNHQSPCSVLLSSLWKDKSMRTVNFKNSLNIVQGSSIYLNIQDFCFQTY